jgi:hypothetical protein
MKPTVSKVAICSAKSVMGSTKLILRNTSLLLFVGAGVQQTNAFQLSGLLFLSIILIRHFYPPLTNTILLACDPFFTRQPTKLSRLANRSTSRAR